VTDDDLPFDIRDAMRKRSIPAPRYTPVENPLPSDNKAEAEADDSVSPSNNISPDNLASPDRLAASDDLVASENGALFNKGAVEEGDVGIEKVLIAKGLPDWADAIRPAPQKDYINSELFANNARAPLSKGEDSGAIKIIALSWNGGSTRSIQTLFRSFPESKTMAYLIVQSVNSCYQTLNFEVLDELTPLTVVEAKNSVVVLPGYVYLVPFLHAVTIEDGCIRLKEIRVSWPIIQNYASKFFESVASEARMNGVGIVLANELRAANEAGGQSIADFERCGGVEAIMRDGGRVFFESLEGGFSSPLNDNDLIPQRRSAKEIAAYLASFDKRDLLCSQEALGSDDLGARYHSSSSKNILDSIVNTILLDVDQQDKKDHRFFLYSLIYQRMGYLQVNSLQEYFYFVSHSITEREQLSELVGRRWGKPFRTGRPVKSINDVGNAVSSSAAIEAKLAKKHQIEMEVLNQRIKSLQSKNEALENENHTLLMECSESASLTEDYTSVQASMGSALLVLDKNLSLRRFNAAATKLFELESTDIGKPLLQLPANIDLLQLEERSRQVLLRRKVLFIDEIIDDELWCLRVAPYIDQSDVLIGVVVSWADRDTFHYWHQRIHAHESRLEVVLNNAGIGIIGINLDGVLVKANDAVAKMLCYERNGLYGIHYDEIIHPDDLTESYKLMEGVLAGDLSVFNREIRYVRQDRKIISVRVTASLLEGLDKSRQILAMVEDITEQIRLTRQLHQSQKMEALGQLTGGIAHDFNNLLAVIMGHTELARGQLLRPESEKEVRLKRYLDAVQKSADRAKILISQMLIFSHGGQSAPQPVHPSVLVNEVVAIFRASLSPNIELNVEMESQAPAIMIDPVQADQMILNLCLNARDALEGVGEIVISVRRLETLAAECASCHQPVLGDYVEIGVRDTGVGIDPELLGKVFDPFFSTKQVGEGSGLGLSVVHGIIHDHDAHVGLQSVPGEGAHFKLWFPVVGAASVVNGSQVGNAGEDIESRSLSGSGRVMVVDDEPTLLGFLEELLVSRGYSVVPFSKASHAVRYLEEYCDELDMVITDQAMPEVSGLELAAELYQRRPELPVIVCTGSNHDGYYDLIPSPSIKQFLLKPIRPVELLQAVKRHISIEL